MTLAASLDLTYPRAGLRQAVSAEWAKLTTLRSTKWALLLTLLGTVLVTFLSARGSRGQPPGSFDPTNVSLAGLALGSLIIGILGVLSITGEYGSSTIRSSLVATPRRAVFYGAKTIVLGGVALALGLVLSFVAFLEGQAVLAGAAPTATLADPGVLRVLIESGVYLALLTLFGVGIGAIIRHSVGAIGGFVGCTFLLPVILHSVAGNPGRFTPEVIYANSIAAVVPINGSPSSTVGLLLMTLYAVAALVIGGTLLARRDA
ncbi:MAG: ABC transporter permease [Acidimicrobiales bacterium]